MRETHISSKTHEELQQWEVFSTPRTHGTRRGKDVIGTQRAGIADEDSSVETTVLECQIIARDIAMKRRGSWERNISSASYLIL